MFDPPEQVPYPRIPLEVNDCPAHRELALQAARESIILLKNDGLLPLKAVPGRIAVIGPNADQPLVLLGNYNGAPSKAVTPLEGIRLRAGEGSQVDYALGCEVLGDSAAGIADAAELAARSDLAVVVLGLTQELEGEEGQSESVPGGRRSRGDREDLDLPGLQEQLLRAVSATGVPVVLVLLNGSALGVNWAQENVPAILEAWYPGQSGGTALAEVIFGDYNPAGRLPVTFYKSIDQLPPFRDYRMQRRTYRFFRGEPLYPFGFGLSYTTFAYCDLEITPAQAGPSEEILVRVAVENTGDREGDEVVQLYLQRPGRDELDASWELNGFERVHLAPGEVKTVTFIFSRSDRPFSHRLERPGRYGVAVGGVSPSSPESSELSNTGFVTGTFDRD
jgi:beta-glucosidase